jgi:hypothetical protein
MADQTVATQREVTTDEVAHFHEHGWAMLRGLVAPAVCAEILSGLKELMGKHGDRPPAMGTGTTGSFQPGGFFSDYTRPSENNDFIREVAHAREAGHNGQLMLGRDVPVRFWVDLGACKLPEGRPTELGGGSGPTAWHQDFEMPFDRTGATCNFWLALVDMEPEMGTMRFMSGSHHEGALGRMRGETLFETYPGLRERYPVSDPISYSVGDATVHHPLILHSAGANETSQPRWAYIRVYMAADTLYNGATYRWTDDLGLANLSTFDHPRFPLVYP